MVFHSISPHPPAKFIMGHLLTVTTGIYNLVETTRTLWSALLY